MSNSRAMDDGLKDPARNPDTIASNGSIASNYGVVECSFIDEIEKCMVAITPIADLPVPPVLNVAGLDQAQQQQQQQQQEDIVGKGTSEASSTSIASNTSTIQHSSGPTSVGAHNSNHSSNSVTSSMTLKQRTAVVSKGSSKGVTRKGSSKNSIHSRKTSDNILEFTKKSCRELLSIESVPYIHAIQYHSNSTNQGSSRGSNNMGISGLRDREKRVLHNKLGKSLQIPIFPKAGFFKQSLASVLGLPMSATYADYGNPQGFNPFQAGKNDPRSKLLIQIFLYCFKQFFSVKYVDNAMFLQVFEYSYLKERSSSEISKLRNNAIWFDIIMHCINPKNNKSFLMSFVPSLAEGYNAKYITGSGESRATSDRVKLFRYEGQVIKVAREPRNRQSSKRKQQPLYDNRSEADDTSMSTHQQEFDIDNTNVNQGGYLHVTSHTTTDLDDMCTLSMAHLLDTHELSELDIDVADTILSLSNNNSPALEGNATLPSPTTLVSHGVGTHSTFDHQTTNAHNLPSKKRSKKIIYQRETVLVGNNVQIS